MGTDIAQLITQVGGYAGIAIVLIWQSQKTEEAHQKEISELSSVVRENTGAISRLSGLVEGLTVGRDTARRETAAG